LAARGIFLIGFSGTGKSTIARLVAGKLGWPVHDLDDVIVERCGMTIPAIFQLEGEEGFRLREAEALQALSAGERFVIATGGGAAMRAENRRLMASRGWVVSLEGRPETLARRIRLQESNPGATRPLLDAADPLDRIRSLKQSRQAVYVLADWTVHTDRLGPEQVAAEVLRAVELLEATEEPPARFDAPAPPAERAGTAALSGLRVLDLTNVLAGPFCAYQLAMLGAEVIKVEQPGTGDLARHLGADEELNRKLMGASFLAQNAGKKSITINFRSEEGRAVFLRLVETADVLVENFRPGVMDRLGLGHARLEGVNPRLVYCAISGFGQDGPLRNAPAYDQIVQGMSGLMSISGDAESAPLRVGYPVADTIGGITAAFAIASALVRRQRTGQGAFLDVSMLDATIVTMGWVISNFLIAHQTPVPMGNDNFTAAPSGTFRTRQGLLNIAANEQEQFESLAHAIGRDGLVADPRFVDRALRKRHRAALTEEIEAALASMTAEEWEALLNASGVPAGRVLTVPEILQHPQVQHRKLLKTFAGARGVGRDITLTLAGFKMSGADPDASAPPPALGEHTDEVLRGLGCDDAEVARLRKIGAV